MRRSARRQGRSAGKRARWRVLMASILALVSIFAGVASANCTIHVADVDASSMMTADAEQSGHGHDSPGDEDCLASPVLSSLECGAPDAAWSVAALFAGLPSGLDFVSTGIAAALLAEAPVPPSPEPAFRRFPKLLI